MGVQKFSRSLLNHKKDVELDVSFDLLFYEFEALLGAYPRLQNNVI
jgi:hypothetical protein